MALYLTEADVNELLTMDIALEAVEEVFRWQAAGAATNVPRSRLKLGDRTYLNYMVASAPGLGVMGLKTYTVVGVGPASFYVQLNDVETGQLLAFIEANSMGQIRTGAASGVATKHMAREDAATVGVIGSGYQARTQLEAMCRVRDIQSARVYSRDPERRQGYAEEMSAKLGIEVTAVDGVEACVQEADIVITITTSTQPVLKGEWLSLGTHVNAAGANHHLRREIDDETVRKAGVLVADDVAQAKIECGDFIGPIERGIVTWEQVHELATVVSGAASGRIGDQDITVFASQGMALQDIATGLRVYELAKAKGIGVELPA